MVSLAHDQEMETDWSAEEPKPSPVKPEASSGPAEMELPTQREALQTPGQEGGGGGGGEEPCEEGEEEMRSQPEEGEGHTLESYCDSATQRGGGRADGKKLRKTNSWKTVRFQDPSQTFEELFKAKDWQNITGRIGNMQIHKYNAQKALKSKFLSFVTFFI